MIEKIKQNVTFYKGKKCKFKYNFGRNQIESFEGVIDGVYNFVFTVSVDNGLKKSFSYNDILIGNLKMYD